MSQRSAPIRVRLRRFIIELIVASGSRTSASSGYSYIIAAFGLALIIEAITVVPDRGQPRTSTTAGLAKGAVGLRLRRKIAGLRSSGNRSIHQKGSTALFPGMLEQSSVHAIVMKPASLRTVSRVLTRVLA